MHCAFRNAGHLSGLTCVVLLCALSCAKIPERDPARDARDVGAYVDNHPADLNARIQEPSAETLALWLEELESSDVTTLSRAKTRLLRYAIQVSDFLVQNWLRGDDYRPRGDDALISCVDLLVQHDASFEDPQPWLADL
ncbi:MAG: hypothetical protein KDB07_06170, partial [Planctomycetes bacterium]|nr:hypothetical protein [Planctomycetota bacterium]